MRKTLMPTAIASIAILMLLALITSATEALAQTTVRYQDKTAQTGLTLEDDPIDSAMMEGSGDGFLDLQFHYGSSNADFFESSGIINGLPFWNENTIGFYAPDEIPGPGSTAPVTLDYDNDGIMDLFLGSASGGRLYRGTGSSFTEVTASVSGSGFLFGYDDDAITAGDYDGDGWTDLVDASGGSVHLQRNLGVDGSGQHLGYDRFAGDLFTSNVYAGAVALLDIDDDGDLDIFVGDKSGGPLCCPGIHNTLLINQGGDPVSWSTGVLPHTLANEDLFIYGVAVADIFQDVSGTYPELVLAGQDRHLFRNDAGDLAYETSFGTNSSFDGSVRILDADLDGALDILHFADTDGALLHRQTSTETFTNVSSTVGLSGTGVVSGLVADFDQDGDEDIVQADVGTGDEYFLESWDTTVCPNPPCAAGADDPANDWVRVTLAGHAHDDFLTDRTTNSDLIGTRLGITTGPMRWVQGLAGSSSSPGIPLTFGDVGVHPPALSVQWPNGATTSHTLALGNSYTLQDQSIPYVKDNTVTVTKTFGLGTVSFDFDWETVGPSEADSVVITHVAGGGDCHRYAVTLSSDASQSQTQKSLNAYDHHMEYVDEDCHANCSFDVEVISNNSVARSWSTKQRVTIKSCIGG